MSEQEGATEVTSHWWLKDMNDNYWLSLQFLPCNPAREKPPTVTTSPSAGKAAGGSQAGVIDSNDFGGPTCNINVWSFRGVEKTESWALGKQEDAFLT